VLLQMGLSVDGIVAAGPQGTSEAGQSDEDDAVRRWKMKSLDQVGTHITGRVTYEQMAGTDRESLTESASLPASLSSRTTTPIRPRANEADSSRVGHRWLKQ
jgi:hypothetical protein